VVVRLLGDPEPHRHGIEELVLEFDAEPLEKLPDVKDQLELTHMERLVGKERLVNAPIRIGVRGENVMGMIAMHHQEVEAHAACRLPVHGVEYVRRQASNTRHLVFLPPLGRTIGKNFAPSKGVGIKILPTGPFFATLSPRRADGMIAP
jgi:hypothetical protein